jgi:hypothetical protein
MESNEKVYDYFNQITQVSNSMKACGEVVTNHNIVGAFDLQNNKYWTKQYMTKHDRKR